ncbi:tRNA (adenosine(37)-N6)-dimethylallyltransferase MiaA [Candidatus Woesebacteria bacterium RIFCSPLOWO2_01_FULL_39_23]|uniref:tRNA dimethylallyltransferase n=1 Tax=Candidatus Woesebacteria bacterium RIFCSPHIGHO2_01_FULL_40_22 TaxID=1802499 RepID=A0A1F7YF94_9BACT|nr:MAG: tRNA (adenosine(37)-N6)-dimethylallyltransferase MiaA [Candidatus Woesebacteria bacterium RBG_16_40_11]OGM25952.1 MAG: tRNA (adenosine(37)-N6)-dimethylallyltransferase MiaA [Candidatus Woesebacteria bacterium RIFCSPHIGHO2_01_FULL_40_22]OGM38065.1 MAG: tRNA (adenosine(37)-N6)-dimethylallyltransferase MiaA [Candidatus Woesebacteria bacterium RIFCSPHIGHO2_12_FULL_38_9]OGM61801.1 MAG: tRNA (adenosine(37)-N6)-dimethylallyltransferase MiaA [Candidatus Woesebacteria bacterium RIFCSPLOWO2_01_FUL
MRKLLVICGPTATGKTELGMYLAKMLAAGPKGSGPGGEIVSADSRQIYKGMDIGTGKDLPKKSKIQKLQDSKLEYGFFNITGVRMWGYDIVEPNEDFSVARYINTANLIIKDIWRRNKLPILVGGTGFYIKGVVDGIPTASVPKSLRIREKFKDKLVKELQDVLRKFDAKRFASMNESDKNNPRRLVRAIEIYKSKYKFEYKKHSEPNFNTLFIGLTTTKQILDRRIEKRVRNRLQVGFEDEIRNLLKAGITWDNQAMQALGYRQWQEFFTTSAKSVRNQREFAIESWIRSEKQYAKRQLIWFKKDNRIKWFDIKEKDYVVRVEKLVREWHNN